MIWDTPSEDHNGSMPIGNGETGVNLWVEKNGDIALLLSRTDSWDDNERLCKLGRVRLQLEPSFEWNHFSQELRLEEGEIFIASKGDGGAVELRIIVDALSQRVFIHGNSDKDLSVKAHVELWRDKERVLSEGEDQGVNGFKVNKTVYPDQILSCEEEKVLWCHANRVSPWQETLKLQRLEELIETQEDPLINRVFGACIYGVNFTKSDDRSLSTKAPTKEFLLTIDTHTLAKGTVEQWQNEIENQASTDKGYDEILEDHRNWWSEYWSKSYIHLDGDEGARNLCRGYYLQRWITVCGGRGNYPIKFNGSIFTVNDDTYDDPDYRRWGGCYWFQNTRLPYWPMFASGDFELMKPLFKMFMNTLELARFRTKKYFDHEGVFFPETMSSWGTYDNGDYGWGYRREGEPGEPTVNKFIRFLYSGSLELLAMMLDYYNYTKDEGFLKNELTIMSKEILLWWEKHWPRNENGKLHMYPSYACESFWNCTNPTPDVAGLIWCLDGLLSIGRFDSELVDRWRHFREILPELPTTKVDGVEMVAVAEGELPKRTNSENPELYAVFPFRIFGLGKKDIELALRAFNNRGVKSNVGWRQDETQAAYLGLTETASEFLVGRAKTKHKESRFPAFWGPNFDWIPDQDHGGNLCMGLQAMILQADDGEIRVLPSWPEKWDVHFKLHAPDNTIVEGGYVKGELQSLILSPEERMDDVILNL